jgi:hypothetical protein
MTAYAAEAVRPRAPNRPIARGRRHQGVDEDARPHQRAQSSTDNGA